MEDGLNKFIGEVPVALHRHPRLEIFEYGTDGILVMSPRQFFSARLFVKFMNGKLVAHCKNSVAA
jgi:hypothetical protein